MFTQCPKCSTVFRVREEQLARHKGLVRCGNCRETFNAAWNEVRNLSDVRAAAPRPAPPPRPDLSRRPPPPAPPTPGEHRAKLWKPLPPLSPLRTKPSPTDETVPEPPLTPHAVAEGKVEPALPPIPPPESVPPPPRTLPERESHQPEPDKKPGFPPPPATPPDEEPDTLEEIVLESRDNFWERVDQPPVPAPSLTGAHGAGGAREPAPATARRQSALAWGVAAVVLFVIAVWQIGFFYFDTLAQSPSARPILEALCSVFRCQVPARRQLSRIDVAGASVAYHDEIPGALKISVNLINRAPFPQAEPTLQVTLTDKDAKIVGRRAYKASEYRRERALLEPNVVTQVTLELAAPPENAVGYEIELFD